MPRKMTDVQLKAKILKADAQAKLRSRVLELFWEGKLSIATHPDIKRSKGAVQSTLCAINYHVVPYHKLPRPPLKKRVFVGVITLARRGVFPKTLDQWKAHTT